MGLNFINEGTKFSWSFLEAYEQCPFKFYNKYGLKRPEPSNIHGLYGCAIHEILKRIYSGEKFYPAYAYSTWKNVIQREYKTDWKQYQYKHLKQKDVDSISFVGFTHLKNFFILAEKEKILKPALFVEKSIAGRYKKHKIVGKLDIGFNIPQYGLTLGDWKTGSEDDKNLFQLMLYAALYQRETGLVVNTLANFYLKSGKTVYKVINKEFRIETGKYLSSIYDAIVTDQEFKPKKNEYCKYCYLKGKECKL